VLHPPHTQAGAHVFRWLARGAGTVVEFPNPTTGERHPGGRSSTAVRHRHGLHSRGPEPRRPAAETVARVTCDAALTWSRCLAPGPLQALTSGSAISRRTKVRFDACVAGLATQALELRADQGRIVLRQGDICCPAAGPDLPGPFGEAENTGAALAGDFPHGADFRETTGQQQ
jgi:hypothetical protein